MKQAACLMIVISMVFFYHYLHKKHASKVTLFKKVFQQMKQERFVEIVSQKVAENVKDCPLNPFHADD